MNALRTRLIGQVADVNGNLLAVGVENGNVAIYVGGWMSADDVQLDPAQQEEFGRFFVAAVGQAGHDAALMAGEAP